MAIKIVVEQNQLEIPAHFCLCRAICSQLGALFLISQLTSWQAVLLDGEVSMTQVMQAGSFTWMHWLLFGQGGSRPLFCSFFQADSSLASWIILFRYYQSNYFNDPEQVVAGFGISLWWDISYFSCRFASACLFSICYLVTLATPHPAGYPIFPSSTLSLPAKAVKLSTDPWQQPQSVLGFPQAQTSTPHWLSPQSRTQLVQPILARLMKLQEETVFQLFQIRQSIGILLTWIIYWTAIKEIGELSFRAVVRGCWFTVRDFIRVFNWSIDCYEVMASLKIVYGITMQFYCGQWADSLITPVLDPGLQLQKFISRLLATNESTCMAHAHPFDSPHLHR